MKSRLDILLRFALLGFAFSIPISIVPAQLFAYASLLLWLAWVLVRRDFSFWRHPFFWPVVAFAAVVVLSACWALHPAESWAKVNRLVLMALIFALAGSFPLRAEPGWRGGAGLAAMFLAGLSVRGLYDVIRVPVEVLAQGHDLFGTGNMRDPQMYLAGLCLVFALWLCPTRIPRPLLWVVTILTAAGLVLHFKRGAWLACLLALALMGLASRRWKHLLILAACVAALLALPQARERLGELSREWSMESGGRLALWTRVAPALLTAHPLGIGYSGTQESDFSGYGVRIEQGLNHLHNNVLQMALELGPLGLIAWLSWMGAVCWLGLARYRADPQNGWLALGAWGAFCGLMINGWVEYNFGDSEILMLLWFLLGLMTLHPSGGEGRFQAVGRG